MSSKVIQESHLYNKVIASITSAMKGALTGPCDEEELAERVEDIHSAAESFSHYAQRVPKIKKHGGYLSDVVKHHPDLKARAAELEQSHDELQAAIDELMPRMTHADGHDRTAFDSLCGEVIALMDRIMIQNHAEAELLQEGA